MNKSCLIQHANKHCLIIAFVYLPGLGMGAEKFSSPIANYDFWSFDLILKSGWSRELSALLISENQGIRLSVSNKVVNLIIWPILFLSVSFLLYSVWTFQKSIILSFQKSQTTIQKFSFLSGFLFFWGRKISRWNHELLCLLFELLSLWSGLEWSN